MALREDNEVKLQSVIEQQPYVTIFLQPIAPPAALGLAGFSGSTFIVASWIAGWWGNSESPLIFFPFVAFWGGLSQFIAGLMGYKARDVLVTVINTMWGAFWMSIGLLYAFVVSLPALLRR
jgi:succinate-acetate transporter protein